MGTTRTRKEKSTAERILDAAERLAQTRGFNGFSYADVAAELGITKASLHYHFSGKAELGEALMERYARRFAVALASIDDRCPGTAAKLDAYAALYADVLRGKRMCLCGMLAAEYQTLPEPMRTAVIRFFDDNTEWLAGVLEDGDASIEGSPSDAARSILSGLEGAMLVARSYGDPGLFDSAARRLIASIVD